MIEPSRAKCCEKRQSKESRNGEWWEQRPAVLVTGSVPEEETFGRELNERALEISKKRAS